MYIVVHCKECGVVFTLGDSVDMLEICSVNVVLEAILQVPPHSEIEKAGKLHPIHWTWMVENMLQERSACVVARIIVRRCGDSTKTPQP